MSPPSPSAEYTNDEYHRASSVLSSRSSPAMSSSSQGGGGVGNGTAIGGSNSNNNNHHHNSADDSGRFSLVPPSRSISPRIFNSSHQQHHNLDNLPRACSNDSASFQPPQQQHHHHHQQPQHDFLGIPNKHELSSLSNNIVSHKLFFLLI